MTVSDAGSQSQNQKSALFVTITPKTREFFKKCGKDVRQQYEDQDDVEIDEIHELIQDFNKKNKKRKPVLMHEVLEGCQTTQRIPAPAPELSEVEEMRARAAERQYQKSIEKSKPTLRSHERDMSDVSVASKTSAFAGHFVIAFAGAFALGYYFIETFVDPENFTLKAIAGGITSFLTLIIEAVLFIIYEEKQRIKKERAEKERTTVNKTSSTKKVVPLPKKDSHAKKVD